MGFTSPAIRFSPLHHEFTCTVTEHSRLVSRDSRQAARVVCRPKVGLMIPSTACLDAAVDNMRGGVLGEEERLPFPSSGIETASNGVPDSGNARTTTR
jgi:hypothetical protein